MSERAGAVAPSPPCARCGRVLAPGTLKYVVRLVLTADFDGHLEETGQGEGPGVDALIEATRELGEKELMAQVHEEKVFLVCAPCRRRIAEDPLGAGVPGGPSGAVQ